MASQIDSGLKCSWRAWVGSVCRGSAGRCCAGMGSGAEWAVLLSAGLPSGARGKVGPSNSLRALRALRSNNPGQSDDEARCARPPCRCAPRRPQGARAHAGCPLCPAWCVRGHTARIGAAPCTFGPAWFRLAGELRQRAFTEPHFHAYQSFVDSLFGGCPCFRSTVSGGLF